jgi:CheY-like chemotaxis protein
MVPFGGILISGPSWFGDLVSNQSHCCRIIFRGVMNLGANPQFRVLIVDDENVVADSLALVFSTQGYDTRVAYSAEQAADIISQWEPRLIILDVMLPGMNGIDFSIQLKTLCPNCRVLLFSGDQNTANLLQAAQVKGHEFTILPKPVDPRIFLDEAARLASADRAPSALNC